MGESAARQGVPLPIEPVADMESATLAFLASRQEPVGSQRLREVLAEAGIAVSEATVGRFLRTLDQRGYTHSIKNTRGRVITTRGEERLAALRREQRRASLSAELVDASHSDDLTALLDLLHVRRAIEPEGVRHAVRNASDAEIETIAGLAEAHLHGIAGGDTVGPAMDFHRVLAAASHNSVLAAVTSFLLDPVNDRLAHLQRRISIAAGNALGYAHDHREIGHHLRARDAAAAERAMREHIDRMIAAVEAYRATTRLEPRACAPRSPAAPDAGR